MTGKSSFGNMASISSLVNQARVNPGKVLKEIALDEIATKKQLRTRFKGIDELAQSLKSVGQQQPIVVSPKNSDGKYVIQKGERRYRAAIKAGLATLDCIVREPNSDAAKELIAEMAENVQRENYHPLEIAMGIQSLIEEFGLKKGEAAEALGKSPAYITTHLKLLELDEEGLKLVEDEVIRDIMSLNHLVSIQKVDPELAHDLCALARTKGLSRKQLEEHVKQLKAGDGEHQPTSAPEKQSEDAATVESTMFDTQHESFADTNEKDDTDKNVVAPPATGQTTNTGKTNKEKGESKSLPPEEPKPQAATLPATVVYVIWKSPEGDVEGTLDLSTESDEEGRVTIHMEHGSATVEAESIQIKAIKRGAV